MDTKTTAEILSTLGKGGGFTVPEIVSRVAVSYPRANKVLAELQSEDIVVKDGVNAYSLKDSRSTADILSSLTGGSALK